jgi:hypothetical protein
MTTTMKSRHRTAPVFAGCKPARAALVQIRRVDLDRTADLKRSMPQDTLTRRHFTPNPYKLRSNPHNDCGTPYVPQPRFPPLEAFGRRPQQRAARSVTGRHPKPFNIALFANIENWDIVCEKFYHQDFVEGTP